MISNNILNIIAQLSYSNAQDQRIEEMERKRRQDLKTFSETKLPDPMPNRFYINIYDLKCWKDIEELLYRPAIYEQLKTDYEHFWMFVSEHEIVTEHILENNIDLPWHWPSVTRNNNISAEFILKHIDPPTGPFKIEPFKILDPQCKKEMIKESYKEQYPLVWRCKRSCKCRERIPSWDWKYLSTHKKITWLFIHKTIHRLDVKTLSSNPKLSTDVVEMYPCFGWDEWALKKRKKIHDYNKVANLAPLLKIFANEDLPIYLIMEFFSDTSLTFGQLFTIIN